MQSQRKAGWSPTARGVMLLPSAPLPSFQSLMPSFKISINSQSSCCSVRAEEFEGALGGSRCLESCIIALKSTKEDNRILGVVCYEIHSLTAYTLAQAGLEERSEVR